MSLKDEAWQWNQFYDRIDSLLERFAAPNVRHRVDGPCDVKRQQVAEDGVLISDSRHLIEEIAWEKDRQDEAAEERQWNVISEKVDVKLQLI